jgi:hypothetical protein
MIFVLSEIVPLRVKNFFAKKARMTLFNKDVSDISCGGNLGWVRFFIRRQTATMRLAAPSLQRALRVPL